ncbi:MAG: hypothetical protein AAFX85_08265, partial [Pseudomonadota bacterium]
MTRIMMEQVPPAVIGTTFVFLLNLSYYLPLLDARTMAWWATGIWAMTLARVGLVLAYRTMRQARRHVSWVTLLGMISLGHGCVWGAALANAVMRLPPLESELLLVSVAGISGAAVGTSCASLITFSAFALPIAIALPLAGWFTGQSAGVHLMLLWIAYFAILFLVARSFSRLLRRHVLANIQNEELIARLQELSVRDS